MFPGNLAIVATTLLEGSTALLEDVTTLQKDV